MIKRLEMGRAVLASSQQNIELWLTTLITISSSQPSINLEQLSSHHVLSFLSSGQVWIGRSGSTRIEICLTLRGEHLPHLELQDILQSILQAPVWSQLRLRVAVPGDFPSGDGIVCFDITGSEDDEPSTKRDCHRLFDNVSYTDLQPPESFPKILLQVVRFSMDILDSKQGPPLKRSSPSRAEIRAQFQGNEDKNSQANEDDDDDDSILHEWIPRGHVVETLDATTQSSGNPPTNARKRKRLPDRQDTASSISASTRELRKCKRENTFLGMPLTRSTPPSRGELTEIELLVERAMRLSITGASKSSGRIKIKANTFFENLSDIAPVLWKPGHLATLAQRARLLPTICRSLGSAIASRATSVSLSEKLKQLAARPEKETCGDPAWQYLPVNTGAEDLTSSIIDRSWLHLQLSLVARPTPPLHALVNINTDAADLLASDEILECSMLQEVPSDAVPSPGHPAKNDAVACKTRNSSILSTDPSPVTREYQQFGSRHRYAYVTAQTGSQEELLYMRHHESECPSRVDSSKSTALQLASHDDQKLTSPTMLDDLLFET